MWVGPTEMRARFPIGARAGRGARRLENVPPSLSEISTPAKNATGHSTGARAPVDARDDRRRARHRTTGARAGRVRRRAPAKIQPVIHPMNELSHRMSQNVGGSYRDAGTFSNRRARRTKRAPIGKCAAVPIRNFDTGQKCDRSFDRRARARRCARRPTTRTPPDDGRARRPRPPQGPGQNPTGHSSDERVESSDEPKCGWVLPRCGHVFQSARAPDGCAPIGKCAAVPIRNFDTGQKCDRSFDRRARARRCARRPTTRTPPDDARPAASAEGPRPQSNRSFIR
jgi:hypothetical protein